MSTLRSAAFALLLSLCTLIPEAHAQFTAVKQIESSLLVTGTVDVDAGGRVLGYAVDEPEKLPQGILNMTAGIAPHWQFEAAAKEAQPERLKMRLFFVSRKVDATSYEVGLRSADFAKADASLESRLRIDYSKFIRPHYPKLWETAGVTGTVFLAVRVGRDGRATDVAVRQTNVETLASQAQLRRLREAAERSVLAAAAQWRFLVPTQGPDADQTQWVGQVPIEFSFERAPPDYGKWRPYVAGPYVPVPWMEEDARSADQGPEALSPGALHSTTDSRRLISPLQGG